MSDKPSPSTPNPPSPTKPETRHSYVPPTTINPPPPRPSTHQNNSK